MTVEELQVELKKAERLVKQIVLDLSDRSGLPASSFDVLVYSHCGIGGGSVGFQVDITAKVE